MEKVDRRRATGPIGKTPAISFRLGTEHVDKLRLMADAIDMAQAELLRQLIDKEWDRIMEARKRHA